MFVLRFHDPDPESGRPPDNGLIPVTDHGGECTRREPRHVRQVWQGGGGTNVAPKPDPGASGPLSNRAGLPRGAAMHMPLFAAAFAVRFGGTTAAFECAKHFADAQTLIDKVNAGVVSAGDRTPRDRIALVHALLDDARMLLEAGRANHEQPHGPYDHARAFAKADAALGYARAAEIVFSRCSEA